MTHYLLNLSKEKKATHNNMHLANIGIYLRQHIYH